MKPVLEVHQLAKRFTIGKSRTGYLSLQERIKDVFKPSARTEDFWALEDVSFSVQPGESVGIIGRNGAGKSTLLKILSKITAPTKGKIIERGRVASLLEVGTGFHPELTGRENIFFNGSLLGMKRREIQDKFDAIVDFSGTEKFLDTQLKHYSSGMQLRLAFSVAAFLEPEILVVDEVLAVGDAEFQKKCMGKMEEVSHDRGRTILFVSHHMAAVRRLCSRAILLEKGRIAAAGDSVSITERYLQAGLLSETEKVWKEAKTIKGIALRRASVYASGATSQDPIKTSDDVILELDFFNDLHERNVDVTFDIFDSSGVHLTHFGMLCAPNGRLPKGDYRVRGVFPKNILNTNRYSISITFGLEQTEVLLKVDDVLAFEVEDDIRTRGGNFSKLPGVIHPICHWTTTPLYAH